MKTYNRILKHVSKILGSDITYNDELEKMGAEYFKSNWGGVWPVDKIPYRKIKPNTNIIINVDKSHQPGSHWVAIHVSKNNNWIIYDSYGRCSKKLLKPLIKQLEKRKIKYKDTEYDPEQTNKQKNCGSRSISWLIYLKQNGIRKALKI